VSFALYINDKGEPEVEFYCFCRGKGVIAEFSDRKEANKAKDAYLKQRAEEARLALGQKELDFA
jgi:hypothetical protein